MWVLNPVVVAGFAKASVSHSVDSDVRRAVDRIPLGETIPTMNMFYVYMVPTTRDVCYKYEAICA